VTTNKLKSYSNDATKHIIKYYDWYMINIQK